MTSFKFHHIIELQPSPHERGHGRRGRHRWHGGVVVVRTVRTIVRDPGRMERACQITSSR